jgi:hypothetical protein
VLRKWAGRPAVTIRDERYETIPKPDKTTAVLETHDPRSDKFWAGSVRIPKAKVFALLGWGSQV